MGASSLVRGTKSGGWVQAHYKALLWAYETVAEHAQQRQIRDQQRYNLRQRALPLLPVELPPETEQPQATTMVSGFPLMLPLRPQWIQVHGPAADQPVDGEQRRLNREGTAAVKEALGSSKGSAD